MKKVVLLVALASIVWSCSKTEDVVEIVPDPPKELALDNTIAIKWADATIYHIKHQPNNSPTYLSRALGYVGLTMYESIAPGSIEYKSVAAELNGLGALPVPADAKKIDWETSLNAGQAYIIKKMWFNSHPIYNTRIDSLETAIEKERLLAVKDSSVIASSKKYGISIAEKIYQWSVNDGGHQGNLNIQDMNYVYPQGLGFWSPPFGGQSSVPYPMHPKWGQNRTFIKASSEIPIPEALKYTTDKTSAYYKDFKEIYDITLALTQEQKEIALWWGDDPAVSAAPPGHSYNLGKLLIAQQKPNLFKAAETFAKIGMSVADAFICCFKVKYTYHSERPTGYIRRNINGSFNQFWPEPPFPAFTSGHSTQAAANATVLISVFGNEVTFEDNTHVGRPKDEFRNVEFKKRTFTKIWDTALECGISRLYGGIHTSQDNTVGLEMGKTIGESINKLNWKVK